MKKISDLETIHCQHSRTDRISDRDIHQKGYKATQPLMAGCFMDVLNKAAVASYDCPHSTTYMANSHKIRATDVCQTCTVTEQQRLHLHPAVPTPTCSNCFYSAVCYVLDLAWLPEVCAHMTDGHADCAESARCKRDGKITSLVKFLELRLHDI